MPGACLPVEFHQEPCAGGRGRAGEGPRGVLLLVHVVQLPNLALVLCAASAAGGHMAGSCLALWRGAGKGRNRQVGRHSRHGAGGRWQVAGGRLLSGAGCTLEMEPWKTSKEPCRGSCAYGRCSVGYRLWGLWSQCPTSVNHQEPEEVWPLGWVAKGASPMRPQSARCTRCPDLQQAQAAAAHRTAALWCSAQDGPPSNRKGLTREGSA